MIGWVLKQRIISLDVEASFHFPFLLPHWSPIRDESELSSNRKPCSSFFNGPVPQSFKGILTRLLDDTPNPIWLVCSFTLLRPLPLIVCVIACVHVCAGRHVQICVGAGSFVGVCHVFAVINFSCQVSQDMRYTVCSACQAQLRLHSNSQHCAMVGKNEFFSADLLWKGSKYTHWHSCIAAVKVDCLRVFLNAGQNQTFTQGQLWIIYRKWIGSNLNSNLLK